MIHGRDPSVVDEDVEPTRVASHVLEQLADLFRIRDVGADMGVSVSPPVGLAPAASENAISLVE